MPIAKPAFLSVYSSGRGAVVLTLGDVRTELSQPDAIKTARAILAAAGCTTQVNEPLGGNPALRRAVMGGGK
jgi:hypothetical protein